MTKDGLAAIVWKYPSQKKLETFHLKLFIILSQYSFSYRHFERSEKSSLHNGQRESVRGGAAEAPKRFSLFLIRYRTPLVRKRSLDSARDDETRERAISHSLSFFPVEGCPFGADLSSAFGAPLLQGATQQSCKNADPSQGLLPHIVISSKNKSRKSRIPYDTESRYFLLQSTNPSH